MDWRSAPPPSAYCHTSLDQRLAFGPRNGFFVDYHGSVVPYRLDDVNRGCPPSKDLDNWESRDGRMSV